MRPVYSANNRKKPRKKLGKKFVLLLLVALVAVFGYVIFNRYDRVTASRLNSTISSNNQKTASTPAPETTPTNYCGSNYLDQLILVSISKRQLWACDGLKQVYSSSVITGMEFLSADLTPVGTYHVYAKVTNTYLTGCDTTGCWNDYVNYFMEFLDNKYGIYGLHDATWRSPSDFGNISPNSTKASHGCVELPLTTATFLYNWSKIGTTVTVEN